MVQVVRLKPPKLKLVHLKNKRFLTENLNKHYIISFEKKKKHCDEKEKNITLIEESLSWF